MTTTSAGVGAAEELAEEEAGEVILCAVSMFEALLRKITAPSSASSRDSLHRERHPRDEPERVQRDAVVLAAAPIPSLEPKADPIVCRHGDAKANAGGRTRARRRLEERVFVQADERPSEKPRLGAIG